MLSPRVRNRPGKRYHTLTVCAEAYERPTPFEDIGPPMTAILTSLHVSVIIFVGAFLFTGVDRLEPNRRFAVILKCAILAAGGAVIAKQLLP
jgi:hypothetical protein